MLILGGGFGGIYTALELERRLGSDDNVEVMPVNREKIERTPTVSSAEKITAGDPLAVALPPVAGVH